MRSQMVNNWFKRKFLSASIKRAFVLEKTTRSVYAAFGKFWLEVLPRIIFRREPLFCSFFGVLLLQMRTRLVRIYATFRKTRDKSDLY